MKNCSKCKNLLPLCEFHRDSRKKDGFRPQCKSCVKQWRIKNKVKIRSNCYGWKELNKDKVLEFKKKWRENNKEKNALNKQQWSKANPGKIAAAKAKRRAAMLNRTPGWLTDEDFKEIEAFYMRAKELTERTGIPHEVDHIIPLQGETVSGLHVPTNLQILTKEDNLKKSNKLLN